MAQRFGGKYSPGGERTNGYPGVAPGRETSGQIAPRHPLARRPWWLSVAALPFLPAAFGDGPEALLRGLGAFALISAAAFLIREGLTAEAHWLARPVARRPAVPRKIFGSVLFGLGLALGAQAPSLTLPGALAIGLVGGVLALLAFGPDPMRDKGTDGIDGLQADRAARAVEEGEKRLDEIRAAIAQCGDRALTDRVERFAGSARALFRAVERDPGDLVAARRYLGIYLEGARDATRKFADLWAASRDGQARRDYEALLDDLETNFSARTRDLIEGGREGLEIEIDVLRERLRREGVQAPARGQPDDTSEQNGPTAPKT